MIFIYPILIGLIATILTFCLSKILSRKPSYQYWQNRNMPYLEPNLPFGNLASPSTGKLHVGELVKNVYDTMKAKGWKHGGIYMTQKPIYVVVDLDYVKNVMTKDFQFFSDRGVVHDTKLDPLTVNLFHVSGEKWRNLRTKLTSTFTSAKMKHMFETMVACEANLQKKMQQEIDKNAPINIKDVLVCFTTDVIGSCAFGLDLNTFEDENSSFRVFVRKIFQSQTSWKRKVVRIFPSLGKFFKLPVLPEGVSDFFIKLVEDTVEYREKNKIVRADFLQSLIDLKNKALSEEEYKDDGTSLRMEALAAQCFVFFTAGFHTSATSMSFALYELAKHQDIQDKLRNEINSTVVRHGGKLTYDAIQDMKYLGQVLDESLRKYPPGPLLQRRCVEDYRIPGTQIVLEKNTSVYIPVLGIHYDPEYYPDPEKFDPDRFSDENKNSRNSYTHLPFGEGPRVCICTILSFVCKKCNFFCSNAVRFNAIQGWFGSFIEKIYIHSEWKDAGTFENQSECFDTGCRRRYLVKCF